MTGRAVPEWEGTTPDSPIPTRVKLRVWQRCGGRCAITGKKLGPADKYDFDHIIPLAMGGRHAESNLQIVERSAHREKTKQDVADLAKARRIAMKHTGIWPQSKARLKGRGFQKTRPEWQSGSEANTDRRNAPREEN